MSQEHMGESPDPPRHTNPTSPTSEPADDLPQDRLPNAARAGADPPRNPRVERFGERTEDFVETMELAIGKAVPRHIRFRERARQNTAMNIMWRGGVLALGLCLIGAGIAMLVLPGPGWASIILGLVILASEYTWANRLLAPLRRRFRTAWDQVRDPSRRRSTILASVALMAIGIAGMWWYLATFGFGLPF